jgi:serine/threonine protein kinase
MTDEFIAGYRIEGRLGEGGMGVVYRARDATLNRLVALKVIRPSLSDAGKERFLREARACSAINHPNIVTVYAAGEDQGRPFLAMEFLEGRTLRDVIDEGPIPWEKALPWAIDLLDALGRLHGEGIVHRDLKPENIFVTSEGRVKLMDFGIAHVESARTLTQEGTSLGTAHYMSPEQAAGKKVDQRSDLFSIATVIYEMLSGARPFEGEHWMAVLYSITNAPPKPLSELGVVLPKDVTPIINKALEKNPDDRYPDAGAFKTSLERLFKGEEKIVRTTSKRLVFTIAGAGVLVAAALIAGPLIRGQVAERKRETAKQYNEMAQNFVTQGDLAQARNHFHQAMLADPTYAIPWNNLGALERDQGNLEAADSLFTRAVQEDPNYLDALFNLGQVRWDLGDRDGAARSYEASIASDSTYAPGYSDLAALLLDSGRGDDALAVVQTGLRHSPDNPYLLKKLGEVQSARNEKDTAQASWTKALGEAERRAQDKELAEEIRTTPEDLRLLAAEVQALLSTSRGENADR